MLDYVDRIVVAVRSLDDAERNYSTLLAARKIDDFDSTWLTAQGPMARLQQAMSPEPSQTATR